MITNRFCKIYEIYFLKVIYRKLPTMHRPTIVVLEAAWNAKNIHEAFTLLFNFHKLVSINSMQSLEIHPNYNWLEHDFYIMTLGFYIFDHFITHYSIKQLFQIAIVLANYCARATRNKPNIVLLIDLSGFGFEETFQC